jgi:hypothetical protein
MVVRYRAGTMRPEKVASYATGGRGATDPTGTGALDADQQVIVNPSHTLLFAVNQGSDTIAVFHIRSDGGLEPVKGSPFPSGGHAPASVGLVGDTLVVANNNQDGRRNLTGFRPNYASFSVGRDGHLTPWQSTTIDIRPGASPTQAFATPLAPVVVSTELGGAIRSFRVSADGSLTEAPGSPVYPPRSLFPPLVDPTERLALGIAAHPTRRLLYITMPTSPALAVYSYDRAGRLRFLRAVRESDAYNPCWVHVTPNGRWLYTSNADTANVSVFDLGSDPARPSEIQTVALTHAGNPWNAGIDPSGRFLFQLTQRDPSTLPGDGNTLHVLRIGPRGTLTELGTSPLRLPVPASARPVGVAVVPGAVASG